MENNDQNETRNPAKPVVPAFHFTRRGEAFAPANTAFISPSQRELTLAPPRFSFIDTDRQRARLKMLLESSTMKHVTDTVNALTKPKSAATPPWPAVSEAIQVLADQASNCREFLTLVLAQIHLHQYTGQRSPLRLLPTLLVGPPGVGKTFVVERLARTLNMPYERISLSNATEGFVLSGCPQGYGTSTPGEVAQKLSLSPVINPIVILDELDKAAYQRTDRATVEGALLSLLEPETATHFEDACLRVPLDASHVTWIATANSTASIPEPILSRFQIIQIDPLPDSERVRFLERTAGQILRQHGLGNRQWQFDSAATDRLACLSVRAMRNALSLLLAKHLLDSPDAHQWITTDVALKGVVPSLERRRAIGFL